KNKKARLKLTNIEYHPENIGSMKTPSAILMNKEVGIALEAAIAQLPEKYRLVFMLREIEELPVKESGEILGIEEANVKVRLNRAKSMLRQNLGKGIKEHVYAFHLTRCDRLVNQVLDRIAVYAVPRYLSSIYQVIFHGKKYKSGSIFNIVSFHHPVFNCFDRARADLHFLGNFSGGKFHAQQPQHFPFLIADYRFIGK